MPLKNRSGTCLPVIDSFYPQKKEMLEVKGDASGTTDLFKENEFFTFSRKIAHKMPFDPKINPDNDRCEDTNAQHCYSPDGRWLVFTYHFLTRHDKSETSVVLCHIGEKSDDILKKTRLCALGFGTEFKQLIFSPDSTMLICISDDGTHCFYLENDDTYTNMYLTDYTDHAAFTPDSKYLVTSYGREFHIYSVDSVSKTFTKIYQGSGDMHIRPGTTGSFQFSPEYENGVYTFVMNDSTQKDNGHFGLYEIDIANLPSTFYSGHTTDCIREMNSFRTYSPVVYDYGSSTPYWMRSYNYDGTNYVTEIQYKDSDNFTNHSERFEGFNATKIITSLDNRYCVAMGLQKYEKYSEPDIIAFDNTTGRCVHTCIYSSGYSTPIYGDEIYDMFFCPDGRILLGKYGDGTLNICDGDAIVDVALEGEPISESSSYRVPYKIGYKSTPGIAIKGEKSEFNIMDCQQFFRQYF